MYQLALIAWYNFRDNSIKNQPVVMDAWYYTQACTETIKSKMQIQQYIILITRVRVEYGEWNDSPYSTNDESDKWLFSWNSSIS